MVRASSTRPGCGSSPSWSCRLPCGRSECADRLHDPGASNSLVWVRPLRCDQTAVPAQDRVRRDDGGDPRLRSRRPSALALCCEPSALVVVQPEAFAAELLFEDAILLDQVVDGLGLVSVDPTGEGREEKLKAEEVRHNADRTGEAQGRNSSCDSAVDYSDPTAVIHLASFLDALSSIRSRRSSFSFFSTSDCLHV